jgi:LPS-assembly lipoprotein
MKPMSGKQANRSFRVALLLAAALALAACGFHLRGNAQLPASMQRVHLDVSGNQDLQRHLARALQISGVSV